MGWKTTIQINRQTAIQKLKERINDSNITDEDLGNIMDAAYGNNPDFDYYGYNFIVVEKTDEDERAEYERLKEKFEGT